MTVLWIVVGVPAGIAWLFFVIWAARKYQKRVTGQLVDRIQPSEIEKHRAWTSARGYEFKERDDSWLEFSTRPPFRPDGEIVDTNGEVVNPFVFSSDFGIFSKIVNEQVNNVVTGNRHGREFARFDMGHLCKFRRDPGPAKLRTIIATKFDHNVPFMAVARLTTARRPKQGKSSHRTTLSNEEHDKDFKKRHLRMISSGEFHDTVLNRDFAEWLQQQEVFYGRRNLMAFVPDNGWLYLIQRKRPDPSFLDTQVDFLMSLANRLDVQVQSWSL